MSISRAQDLVLRFNLQILNGCTNTSCTNEACYTGRCNLAGTAPCRRYTPRSARAIAYVLATEPHPERRLCQHPLQDEARPEGTRDPSDLMQIWSEDARVKNFAAGSVDAQRSRFGIPKEYAGWHTTLNDLMIPPAGTKLGRLPDGTGCVSHFSWIMCRCLIYLIQQAPPVCLPPTVDANGEHRAIPLSRQIWMDAIRHPPAQRILRHFLTVLAARTSIEMDVGWKSPSLIELARTTAHELDVLGDSYRHHITLCHYLEVAFLTDWGGKALIDKLSVAAGALQFLEAFMQAVNALPKGGSAPLRPPRLCLVPDIGDSISPLDLATAWCNYSWNSPNWHLLLFGSLISLDDRIDTFRCISHIRMRGAHSAAEMAFQRRGRLSFSRQELTARIRHDEQRYLLLNVSRSSMLQDAIDQLWHRRRGELLLPLRVRIGHMDDSEVGHDLGGVQIEFFNVICQEVFGENSNTFTTDPESGYSYFQPMSLEPLWKFEMLGLLFGLAVHNAITLPVNLPSIFYDGLLSERRAASLPFDFQPGVDYERELAKIKDGWPTLFTSLGSVATEDIEVEYAFPLEANGLRMLVRPKHKSTGNDRRTLLVYSVTPLEGGTARIDIDSMADSWPGWHLERCSEDPDVVSADTRKAYVRDYVQWLTHESVAPQREAFEQGIQHVVSKKQFAVFHVKAGIGLENAHDIKSYVEGTTRLDLSALRRATLYSGYDPASPYMQQFWTVVQQWPEDKQKALVKFVTAVERLPLNMASFRFVIKKAHSIPLDYLPTSSTCFGTLQLPHYPSQQDLDEKLSRAIDFGLVGFGTA